MFGKLPPEWPDQQCEMKRTAIFFDTTPFFKISLLKVQPHLTLCSFQVALGMNKGFHNSLELLCLNHARMFFTHPFVTRTPVGATSLLSASKDQRYKFWDDFLLVKSCTKIIPEVKEQVARCYLMIHIFFSYLRKMTSAGSQISENQEREV